MCSRLPRATLARGIWKRHSSPKPFRTTVSVKVLVKERGWGMQAALLPESLLPGRLRGGSPSPGYPSLEPKLGVGS